MAEWLIVATFITGAILAIRTVGGRALTMAIEAPVSEESTEDLPCPWCRAATSENDARCPGCGRRFG
ncbi:MAG: hypothetical protein ACE5MI_03260 [Acidimicrobiia bacterium]